MLDYKVHIFPLYPANPSNSENLEHIITPIYFSVFLHSLTFF